MSLLMSASPWTNGNNENKKRPSTMRKTIKMRPYGEPDEYINEDPELKEQFPPSIEDVQRNNEDRSNQVSQLIHKITSLNPDNDGQYLANFNPMPNPILNNKKPMNQTESRSVSGELSPTDLLPSNPYQNSPTNLAKTAGSPNYSANDNNLGKLSNYNTIYAENTPYYSKMGLGNGDPNDKLLEKINYMIHLLEEQQHEKTNNVMEEFVLYTFLGVFMIYIVDSFVRAGKYVR
jgi:hypothetical protein